MPKLATPMQYGRSLDDLNGLRPLALADECKNVVSYPVLCKNPASVDKPAIGKLARASQQGQALLANTYRYADYEYIEQEFELNNPNRLIEFNQQVFFVQTKVIQVYSMIAAWWADATYTTLYKLIYPVPIVSLGFVGTKLYIGSAHQVAGWKAVIAFWGFY